jgi:hypothetical protein
METYSLLLEDLLTCKDSVEAEKHINGLLHDELLLMWRATWHDTMRGFATKYSINQGNFSSWFRSKRRGGSSSVAVRVHLLEYYNSNKNINVDVSIEVVRKTISYEQLLVRIRTFDWSNIRGLVLIDGDNIATSLSVVARYNNQ